MKIKVTLYGVDFYLFQDGKFIKLADIKIR